MARNVKLLLTENVDTLGIVGDVVNVRTGYARNFLLPRNLATEPSEEKVQALAVKRAEAERMLAELRKQREKIIEKLQGLEVHLIRSCNDQGILYGAITQQDIATALGEQGYAVKPREVRLGQTIKRIDAYDVHVKLDSDLDAAVKVWVVADRKLDLEKAAEHPAPEAGPAPEDAEPSEDRAPAPKVEKGEKREKGEKVDRREKADKGEKAEKGKKPAKEEAASDKPAKTGTFAKADTQERFDHKPEKAHKREKDEAKHGKGDKKKAKK
jgi:large subunit ribosomal protein L9